MEQNVAARRELADAIASVEARCGHRVTWEQGYALPDGRYAARMAIANGLNIILLPDARSPIFAYQSWFGVGSGDEDPDQTGLAHLLEHLMFKGTPRFGPGTFDREMERRGAQTNAATWLDWTYYTAALPHAGDNLGFTATLEADRMAHLQVDAEALASELEVVKNERRMAVDDDVAGRLGEALMQCVYRRHPYRGPTVGRMAHLARVQVADVQAFYRNFYAPNNAAIVVVGGMDVREALWALVAAYAPLPARRVVRRPKIIEAAQRRSRRRRVVRPILVPQVSMGFAGPAQADPDFCALELLCDVLVHGHSARLRVRLIDEERLATDVTGEVLPLAQPSLMELGVVARAGASPERIVAVVQEELDRLADGIGADERQKALCALQLEDYETQRSVEGMAEAIGHHHTTAGDFTRAFCAMARYEQVTPAQLRAVARRVLRHDNSCIVVAQAKHHGASDADAGAP